MVTGLADGSGKAVWRSSQHDFEDAAFFCSAGLFAPRTAGVEGARSLHGVDRQGSCGRQERPRPLLWMRIHLHARHLHRSDRNILALINAV